MWHLFVVLMWALRSILKMFKIKVLLVFAERVIKCTLCSATVSSSTYCLFLSFFVQNFMWKLIILNLYHCPRTTKTMHEKVSCRSVLEHFAKIRSTQQRAIYTQLHYAVVWTIIGCSGSSNWAFPSCTKSHYHLKEKKYYLFIGHVSCWVHYRTNKEEVLDSSREIKYSCAAKTLVLSW